MRAKYLQNYRLSDIFNADGSLKAEISAPENAGNTSNTDEHYSLKKSADGVPYVDVDSKAFTEKSQPKEIASVLSEIVRTKFNDLINVNGQDIGIKQKTAREWVRSKSATSLLNNNRTAFTDKQNAFGNSDELLKASRNYISELANHNRTDSFVGFARGTVNFKVGERGYEADIVVGTTRSGAAVLYDLVNIQKKRIVADASYADQFRRSDAPTTDISISDLSENVNTSPKNNFDKRYYSVDLRGAEQQIQEDLAEMSAEAGEDIHVHTEDLSHKAQENLTKMKKALTSMNEHRGESENYVNYVIVNPNSKFNGAEKRGNTIYIAADALERDASASYLDEASRSGNIAGTLMHEYEHTNEIRTKDGRKRTAADLELLSYLEQDPELVKAAEERVYSDYGISKETLENIRQKKKNGIELTAEEKQHFATFDSEYGATLSEYAFGSEYVMRRLVIQNEPLVERIIGKLGDLKARLAGKSDGYSRAERKRINKALDLYLKAAEAAGKKNLAMRIMAMREEDEEAVTPTDGSNTAENTENEAVTNINGQNMHVSEVDSEGEIRYNLHSEKYSDEEYRAYGWARANDVLSASENSKARSAFASATQGLAKYPKSKSGEYMIAVGDNADNKIIYITGSIDSPVITRVLEIDEYNETKLDKLRRETYELERRGIQQKAGRVFNTYFETSFRSPHFEQRGGTQSQRYNNKLGIIGRGSSKTASRIKEILFDDEGNVVSETHFSYKSPSEGSIHKQIAEWEKLKVYEKSDAEKMLYTILSDVMTMSESESAVMTAENRKAAEKLLWSELNYFTDN